MQSSTRPTIAAMKKQAKELKKASGLTHCQALHAIAQNQGYKTWVSLLAAYGELPNKTAA